MYRKNFLALTEDQIKMVNASALARQFNCTSMWIGKVLKLTEEPTNEKTKQIHKAARDIVEIYESQTIKKG